MLKRIIFILLFTSPLMAWAFVKPVRVVFPEFVSGISYLSKTICIEKHSNSQKAVKLYEDALQFVNSSVGVIAENPCVIFCSTETCFQSFGFNKGSAMAIGTFAIVISPRGWTDYYVRHEMIHHLQAERFGVFKQLQNPKWLKEGMAYSLSQHPRRIMPEAQQEYRRKFETWFQSIKKEQLWNEARNL